MNKKILLTIGLLSLCVFGFTVSATTVTDPTSDVAHWSYTGTTWNWAENIGTKPNIDITELSQEKDGDTMVISIKVEGTIQDSQYHFYSAWFNTSDAYYWFTWTNGQGNGLAAATTGEFKMSAGDVTVSGDTITASFAIVGEDTNAEEFYGYAYEYTSVTDYTSAEYWGDWVPNSDAPFYGDDSTDDSSNDNTTDDTTNDNTTDDTTDNGNDNTTDDNTDNSSNGDGTQDQTDDQNNQDTTGSPGFELIFLLAGIMVLVLILKRRT
jgi:hypothetical protein